MIALDGIVDVMRVPLDPQNTTAQLAARDVELAVELTRVRWSVIIVGASFITLGGLLLHALRRR